MQITKTRQLAVLLCSNCNATTQQNGPLNHHDAGAVVRRQEHGQARSEAREGAAASAGARVPGRAGSQWCLAGSPPSGDRHGHCQAS